MALDVLGEPHDGKGSGHQGGWLKRPGVDRRQED